MAAQNFPQEVAEHLEAAIQLSNRRVLLRFLDEADGLVRLNLPLAAVRIAGVALECLPACTRDLGKYADPAPDLTLEQAKAMVAEARGCLAGEDRTQPKTSAEAIREVRGKYRFVPTSADDFILRKADELRVFHATRRSVIP
jgi:hypothetical protein